MSAFFSVIYKSLLTLVTFQAAKRTGKAAPSPVRVCPSLSPVPAGMTLALGRSRATWSRFPLLRFGFRSIVLICCWQLSRCDRCLWSSMTHRWKGPRPQHLIWSMTACDWTWLLAAFSPPQVTSASEWKMLVRFLFQPSTGLLAISTLSALAIFSQRMALRKCGGIKFPQVQCLL